MKNFLKVMLGCAFTVLIACSVQNVYADDLTGIFKPVSIAGSEYQFHLQTVLRDSDGRLISVTESTNGYYIPHDRTDRGFATCFGLQFSDICTKEIVDIDNEKYDKIQFTVSREDYENDEQVVLMFSIVGKVSTTIDNEIIMVDVPAFQAFVPLVYLDDDTVIANQWTIFKKIN